ncbi:Centrosomal protein of 41 kDa [Geodia barretti]|uniref:Centrosomal protein of 41 kDa n=1 Tax=Geodia barretti TaxID=519541 RepID=A0AA35RRF0_GEOBA|nr:Centrosomal protein of 41 kDa [Geodia barretti]
MMSWRSNAKKSDPLNKRIPKNPKYSHVKATVDTGASLGKYLARLEDMRKNYRFRPDEIFKRLKATTFVQLVVQVALTRMQDDEEVEDEEPTPLPEDESPPDTARSTLNSIVHGIGELDVADDEPSQPPSPRLPPTSPYLLLDVRDTDEYQRCHVISAKSYPVAMLSRSCNYFTQDILDYSNKPGHIIILYDDNERMAPQAATVFVQRGVDNVFLLSGGMRVLHRVFPQGIITGSLPPSCLPSPPPSSRRSQRTPRHPPALPALPIPS